MEANMIEELTSNRLDWKERVKKRQLHMQEYERQQGKTDIIPQGTDKIYQEAKESDVKMQSVCIKIAIGYLEQELHSPIHQKRLHRDSIQCTFICMSEMW